MSTKKNRRFARIQEYVKEMSNLALNALKKGVESFEKLDQTLAAKVIAEDDKLDELDDKIETEIVRAIARFQPVATDIRLLSVHFKVITDLRRIGRYGYDMALLTQRMEGLKHFKKLIKLPEMARMAERMTTHALDGLFDEKAESPLKKLLEDDLKNLKELGGKHVIDCDCRWSDGEYSIFSVSEFPDMDALQKHTKFEEENGWFRCFDYKFYLGTRYELQ